MPWAELVSSAFGFFSASLVKAWKKDLSTEVVAQSATTKAYSAQRVPECAKGGLGE